MVRIALAVALLAAPITLADSDEFCAGFNEGYKAGWCDGQNYGCVEPVVPVCPISPPGGDNFRTGYATGFKKAMYAKMSRGY